jgi:hydrogenase expression/formation protein HypC
MCLAVPGRVIEIQPNPLGMTVGRASFGGVVKDVCLAYTPEVKVGDYVVVHVGFALSIIDEEEALRTLEYQKQIEDMSELNIPNPDEDVE